MTGKIQEIKNTKKDKWGDLLRILISVLLGAIITLIISHVAIYEDKQNLIKTIYLDIKTQTDTAKAFSEMLPVSDFSSTYDIYHYSTNFNMLVINAYINKLALLPTSDAEQILEFYSGLQIINELNNKIEDRINYIPAQRKEWSIFISKRESELAIYGKKLVDHLKKNYKL